jgi:hypothetical protein
VAVFGNNRHRRFAVRIFRINVVLAFNKKLHELFEIIGSHLLIRFQQAMEISVYAISRQDVEKAADAFDGPDFI